MPSYKELYEPLARQVAEEHDIDVPTFLSLINVESTWNPYAVSGDGAVGLGQVIPVWHPECPNLRDPVGGLHCSAAILRSHLNAFNGRYDMALAAYHRGGPTAHGFGGKVPQYEMDAYVSPILRGAETIRAEMKAKETPTEAVPLTATATPPSPLFSTPTPTPTFFDVTFLLLPFIWACMNK